MDEGLQVDTVRLEGRDLAQAELAGEDGALAAEARQRGELRRAVRAELRAGVERQIRVLDAHPGHETEVGDDEGIEAGEVRRFQRRQRRTHLLIPEQGVQRQVRSRVI